MSHKSDALYEIQTTRHFFHRSTRCLDEGDSGFRATPETMTVAQQVAHTALTIDWLRDGMFDDNWDMDFEKGAAAANAFTSLDAARAYTEGQEFQWAAVINAVVDHTGHHRGALTVYARLAGKVPEMPYGD